VVVASQSSSSSYFSLLGLPERYDLDGGALERAYLELSKEMHPDRFAAAPAQERLAATQRSVLLNDAYQTLKRPVRRAEYLLGRKGLAIGDNERIADGAFLMQILELREELSEARHAGKLDEVARYEAQMKQHRKDLLERLAGAFARADLPAAKQTLIELRYVDRYLAECEVALEDRD
jgi:molecular chaperone HscB